ncbi:ribosomal protein S18-alanine N-acetyltransferase [Thermovibrio sp.]
MQNLKVKEFEGKEVESLVKLEEECFKKPYGKELLMREVQLPHNITLLAELSGKAVGYLIGWKLGKEWEVHRIGVKKEFRRKGIGRELLKNLVKKAKSEGAEEVFLEVDERNEGALELYLSFGFKVVSKRKNYYGDSNALVLKLKLGGRDVKGRKPQSPCKGKVPPL